MNAKRIAKWFGIGLVATSTLVWAGGPSFTETKYGEVTIALSTSVAFEWTNGTQRLGLGSVFVEADAASNTWTILHVSNARAYTNVLKGPVNLNSVTNTLLYEGYGTVPMGDSAVLRFTGTVNTNGAATTNKVRYIVQMLAPN